MPMQQLEEGLIQHIDRLKAQVRDFLLSVLTTRMLKHAASTGNEQLVDLIKHAVQSTYPSIKQTRNTVKTFTNPKINEVPTNYHQFYDEAVAYWEEVGKLQVICCFDQDTIGPHGGMFDSTTNQIYVSCQYVDTFDYTKASQYVKEGNLKKAQFLVEDWLSKLMLAVAHAYHELIHYIQFSFLSHGHEQQVAGAKGEGRQFYWSSKLEYPAQVEGFAEKAKVWVTRHKRLFPNLTLIHYGAYLLGDMTVEQFCKQTGVSERMVAVGGNTAIQFFRDLKRMRPSVYQRAVKYFLQKLVS